MNEDDSITWVSGRARTVLYRGLQTAVETEVEREVTAYGRTLTEPDDLERRHIQEGWPELARWTVRPGVTSVRGHVSHGGEFWVPTMHREDSNCAVGDRSAANFRSLDRDALMRQLGVQIERQRSGQPMTLMFCATCVMSAAGIHPLPASEVTRQERLAQMAVDPDLPPVGYPEHGVG